MLVWVSERWAKICVKSEYSISKLLPDVSVYFWNNQFRVWTELQS